MPALQARDGVVGLGGGISSVETIPSFQARYGGPVYGASSIAALTGNMRGIPDVSFDASPGTGVSVYDSTQYQGQTGWFSLGGAGVGAPNWAGILAAGSAAGLAALKGDNAIYARTATRGTSAMSTAARTASPGPNAPPVPVMTSPPALEAP